jgi:hypothetical protein
MTLQMPGMAEATFVQDYMPVDEALVDACARAQSRQWQPDDLDWDQDVDQDEIAAFLGPVMYQRRFRRILDSTASPLRSWGPAEWHTFAVESQNYAVSQFLHGEQAALLCAARLVETMPSIEAKLNAAVQVVDEARHVQVFSRYLSEKLSGEYAVTASLQGLVERIMGTGEWDLVYLGMQVMIEGTALALFGMTARVVREPLLRRMIQRVSEDEARHVGFGIAALRSCYDGLSARELRERQEFVLDASHALRAGQHQRAVWDRLGVDPEPIIDALVTNPTAEERRYNALLFSRIVPICGRLGLLDASGGWLRERFSDMGIIRFEGHRPYLQTLGAPPNSPDASSDRGGDHEPGA